MFIRQLIFNRFFFSLPLSISQLPISLSLSTCLFSSSPPKLLSPFSLSPLPSHLLHHHHTGFIPFTQMMWHALETVTTPTLSHDKGKPSTSILAPRYAIMAKPSALWIVICIWSLDYISYFFNRSWTIISFKKLVRKWWVCF